VYLTQILTTAVTQCVNIKAVQNKLNLSTQRICWYLWNTT